MRIGIESALALLERQRMVGIIRMDDLSQAVPLSRALLSAGVCVQEFTLSNPHALEAIRAVFDNCPEFSTPRALLGVGSIRNAAQVEQALEVGVDFVVTPTTNPAVIDACASAQVTCICGALTPTEIATAAELGASLVKVFPARTFGPAYVRDVLAPMPELKLVPTGGVNLENIADFISAGAFAVGIGGNLVDNRAVLEGNWQAVEQSARAYTERVALA